MVGCSKYEHPEMAVPNCELCPYAESIEGTYRGRAGGLAVTPNPELPFYHTDSMTMIVRQIFLGQSPFIDSTKMFFETEYWFDYTQTHKFDTIEITSEAGHVEHHAYSEFGSDETFINSDSFYIIYNDSIRINTIEYLPSIGLTSVFAATLKKL